MAGSGFLMCLMYIFIILVENIITIRGFKYHS